MTRDESVEIARAIRDAAREYGLIDLYSDGDSFHIVPVESKCIGRYDRNATLRYLAEDIHATTRKTDHG